MYNSEYEVRDKQKLPEFHPKMVGHGAIISWVFR